jgi:hypothetical protein
MSTPVFWRHTGMLAAPIVLAIALLTVITAGELAGYTPFAGIIPRNSAEAAGLANAHDVLRFLQAGEDPHRIYPVRPEIISSSVQYATTLEAALFARQLELIKVLDTRGAITAADRPALLCLASDLRVEDVVEYLAAGRSVDCREGKALETLQARTPHHD